MTLGLRKEKACITGLVMGSRYTSVQWGGLNRPRCELDEVGAVDGSRESCHGVCPGKRMAHYEGYAVFENNH